MKPSLGIGAVLLLAIGTLAAEPGTPTTPITKEAVRKAITAFREDPVSPTGRAAGEVVRRFAEESPDVILHVTPKVVPFVNNIGLALEDRTLLLDAFTVGNVDSQLLHNEKKDDPYAGVLEMISTYRRMQIATPTFSLPEVEKMIDRGKRGKLRKYLNRPE